MYFIYIINFVNLSVDTLLRCVPIAGISLSRSQLIGKFRYIHNNNKWLTAFINMIFLIHIFSSNWKTFLVGILIYLYMQLHIGYTFAFSVAVETKYFSVGVCIYCYRKMQHCQSVVFFFIYYHWLKFRIHCCIHENNFCLNSVCFETFSICTYK